MSKTDSRFVEALDALGVAKTIVDSIYPIGTPCRKGTCRCWQCFDVRCRMVRLDRVAPPGTYASRHHHWSFRCRAP